MFRWLMEAISLGSSPLATSFGLELKNSRTIDETSWSTSELANTTDPVTQGPHRYDRSRDDRGGGAR